MRYLWYDLCGPALQIFPEKKSWIKNLPIVFFLYKFSAITFWSLSEHGFPVRKNFKMWFWSNGAWVQMQWRSFMTRYRRKMAQGRGRRQASSTSSHCYRVPPGVAKRANISDKIIRQRNHTQTLHSRAFSRQNFQQIILLKKGVTFCLNLFLRRSFGTSELKNILQSNGCSKKCIKSEFCIKSILAAKFSCDLAEKFCGGLGNTAW
jgi:hypothetical protein